MYEFINKGGEGMYEAIQVISKIDSLNSLSTFHRWRKFAEELCNVEFQKRTIQVGKTSYTKIYEFSESDVEKFRQVAELRSRGRPIKEAIIEVFENQTKKDEIENSEIIEKLIKAIRKMNEELDDLTVKMTDMNQQMVLVRRENYQLKERIIELEKGKLDKPFSRKKT
jgi:DNA-binding transcriptional MerR regulator